MKRYLFVFLASVLIGTAFAFASGGVSAEKPPPIGAHRHFIVSSSGDKVYVGPNFCDVGASAQGFYGFHNKVHVKDPGLVDVMSEAC